MAEFLSELEMEAFVYPPISAQAEIDSFNAQSDKFNTTPSPSPQEISKMLDRMETFYAKSKWKIRDDFCSDLHIEETIEHIMKKNHDKSPGAILVRAGYATNVNVLEALGMSGIVLMVKQRLKELDESEDTKYVADPVRIFEKPEPHKKSKAAEKRWRLIWGVSLTDQIVDRLLYAEVCDASIANSATQAAKVGYNFKSGGVHRMVQAYGDRRNPWYSFDASSFDFTVAGWQLDASRELNERLCVTQGALRQRWIRLSKKREEAIKYGRFVFSDGTVCRQLLPGIQKSGRFTTIDGNCKITIGNRVLYDISKKIPSDPNGIIAMGDDQVTHDVGSAEEYTKFVKDKCGNVLTLECPPGPFEAQNFCSMTFEKTAAGIYHAVPGNYGKTAWNCANMQKKKMPTFADALTGLCIEYTFHPKFQNFYNLLLTVAPSKARSRNYYEAIHLRME